jgi:hypothetical protein
MTTVATGQVLLAGTSPAGLTASFAAPSELRVTRPESHPDAIENRPAVIATSPFISNLENPEMYRA